MAVTSVGTPATTHSATGSVAGTWGTGQVRSAGNLLVAVVSAAASTSVTATACATAGWRNQLEAANTATAQVRAACWTKIATGADTAPTVTSTETGTAGGMDVMLFELNLAVGGSPIDVAAIYASGSVAGTPTLTASTVGVTTPGEYAISCFAQERAAAVLTFTDSGTGGVFTKLLNGNGASSVLQTYIGAKAGPAVNTALNDAGAFSTNTTAFAAGFVIVFAAGANLATAAFADNAAGTVTSGGTTAPASGTVESWTVTATGAFPVATSLVQFCVCDPALPAEKVLVTIAPGGAGSGQAWTVTRGTEGTTPAVHAAGFSVVEVVTAGVLARFDETDWVNAVTQFGADPTGTSDSTAALQAAITATPAGCQLYLPAGNYTTSAPLVIGKRIILTGPDSGYGYNIYAEGYPPSGNTFEPNPQTGAVIKPSASWAQGAAPSPAVILLIAPTHYITEGPVLRHIAIDGTALVATADAIMGYGPVVDVIMDDVCISHCNNWGINTTGDPSTPAGVGITGPGTWKVRDSMVFACGGGILLQNMSDTDFTNVLSIGNSGAGWQFIACSNSHFIGCRAEWNGTHGFYLTGTWDSSAGVIDDVSFIGCSTDANAEHGFFVDATVGVVTVTIIGMFCKRDGNNATPASWAALAISQTAGGSLFFQVIVRGFVVSATTASNGVGPAYGLNVSGTGAWLDVDGARFIGNTGAFLLSSPGHMHLGRECFWYSGASTAPSVALPPSGFDDAYLASAFVGATGTANQNVTGLALTVPLGTYKLRGYIPAQSATAASTCKYNFTFTGTTGAPTMISWQPHGSAFLVPVTSATITTASGPVTTALTTALYYMEVVGYVNVTALGVLQLQVVNGATADATTVNAGAFLELVPAV